jgi:hypothetical protein
VDVNLVPALNVTLLPALDVRDIPAVEVGQVAALDIPHLEPPWTACGTIAASATAR